MSSEFFPLEGGCRCGQVRFRIAAPPVITMACHCTGCQRMSASAFSLSAAIPSVAFQVTQGEPVIGGLHGPTRHFFCAYCMSWMFTRPDGFDAIVNVRVTMLDDPRPFRHSSKRTPARSYRGQARLQFIVSRSFRHWRSMRASPETMQRAQARRRSLS